MMNLLSIFVKKLFNPVELLPFLAVLFIYLIPGTLFSQDQDIRLTLHLRGVYESKVSLLALSPAGLFKPIAEAGGLKNDTTTSFTISIEKLPGEFVLRFDYKETIESAPYPSEKMIFIHDQNLELWVNPKYCNNRDSSFFQANERENSAYAKFSDENSKQKEKLGVLQNFLMNYDDTGSPFYQQGIIEYEKRREAYNRWLKNRIETDKPLFIVNLYYFHHVPQIPWEGSETERVQNLIKHYFDGMDFNSYYLIKTSQINKWMDGYVNLYGQLSTTVALRDSLFPLAGITAIEKARKGDPRVYGWMVDYFYRGYETNGIDAGIKILEPYINDVHCLTSKRQEIARRLKGMETLVPGSQAPEIVLKGPTGELFELYKFKPKAKYILVLFWSADCSHCVELTDQLYPFLTRPGNLEKTEVVAISLDETETEIEAWGRKIKEMKGWKHLCVKEGIRSKEAADYFVLATPVMVLLDAGSKKIIAIPNTLNELKKAIE